MRRGREGGGRCSARPPAEPGRGGPGRAVGRGTARASARPIPLERAAFGDVGSTLLGRPCCRPRRHLFAVVAAKRAERRVPEPPLATLAAGARGWRRRKVGFGLSFVVLGCSRGMATRGPDQLCRFGCSL